MIPLPIGAENKACAERRKGVKVTEYIYGDILFLINFSMDFIALFICGKIMHFRMRAWRMALSASMGGVYGVATLFFTLGVVGDIALDLLVALSLCFVAHYHGSAAKTFAATALFFAVSVLMGGMMTALYSKIGRYQAYISIGGSVGTVFGDIPLWLFALLAAVSAAATILLQRIWHRRSLSRVCRVRITFAEGVYELCAFVDTGNLATEPITGEAVVFLSAPAAKRISGKSGELLFCSPALMDGDEAGQVRFIPINTVSGYTLVSAVKPKKFEVLVKQRFEERKALVACDTGAQDFGGAEALMPVSLI